MLSAHESATLWAALLEGLGLPPAILEGGPWWMTCFWPPAMPCTGTATEIVAYSSMQGMQY